MADQTYNRYLAVPQSGQGAGVLVLHAWWGLNDFMREFCDRLAQEGFVALAPDLYSGKIARTIEEAEQQINQWDEEKVVPTILLPAVEELRKHPAVTSSGLGVVGFSMGAFWSLWIAQQEPDLFRAVSVFYGTDGGTGDFHQSKAAFQGHFAAADPYEPAEGVKALEDSLKAANRPVDFYTYPDTGHWFFEKDRRDAYNAQAALSAWNRTTAFLHEHLEQNAA